MTDQAHRHQLAVLLREAKRKGWWQIYSDIPYSTMIGLEAEAVSMLVYEQVILGLFQTEAYARAIIAGTDPAIDPETLDQRVEVRMTRQAVLTRERPMEVRAVLDETCVRRLVGGREVMRRQLAPSAWSWPSGPTSSSRCCRSRSARTRAPCSGRSLCSASSTRPTPTSSTSKASSDPYPDREGDLERYTMAFDRLRSVALSVPQTNDLLRAALEAL